MNKEQKIKEVIEERERPIKEKVERLESGFSLELKSTDFFINLKSDMSVQTQLAYLSDIRDFIAFLIENKIVSCEDISSFGFKDLKKISAQQVNTFLNLLKNGSLGLKKEGSKDSSIARRKAALTYFFNYLTTYGYVDEDITGKIKKVRQKIKDNSEIKVLSIDETMKLLDLARTGEGLTAKEKDFWQKTKQRDFLILLIFCSCGLRLFELRELNLDSYDEKTNSILIYRKGGKVRTIPFNEQIKEAYHEYINGERHIIVRENIEEKALFLSLKGERLSERQIRNLVKKYTSKIIGGSGYSPHKLRATVATALIEEGHSIYDVQFYLDHDHVVTTERYAKHNEEIKSRIVKSIEWK